MAAIVSSQGIVITALGIVTPYIASVYDWRWIYYITSGLGVIAWLLLIVFLPETRWNRSKEELSMASPAKIWHTLRSLLNTDTVRRWPATPSR